jgi:hypothetical protein
LTETHGWKIITDASELLERMDELLNMQKETCMGAVDVTSRYVTSDFRSSPLIALADLLGLKRFSAQIKSSPEFYGPILSGICLYRHLSTAARITINRAIVREMAPCSLQTNLMGLITDLSVQKYWYMWSLSDE